MPEKKLTKKSPKTPPKKSTHQKKTIGVLAIQGGFQEHLDMIKKIDQESRIIRSIEDLNGIDSLIIPGGESTTMGLFLEETKLGEAIKKRAKDKKNPMPIWGTCAGAIILAKKIKSNIVPYHLDLLDMVIERNAYGRQIESFHTEINIPDLKLKEVKAAFIRAPIIEKVGRKVKTLAKYNNKIILVQQGKILASTFHPELRGDTSLHKYFASL